jgi:toxin ParE1/3/4
MRRFVFAPQARIDLNQIADYLIAEAGVPTALKMIDKIETRIKRLRQWPLGGAMRDDYGDGLRGAFVRPYVIIHKVTAEELRILRIVHGARDLPTLLRDTPD